MSQKRAKGPSKRSARPRAGTPPVAGARRDPGPPSVDSLALALLRGGRELLRISDPFEVELWASTSLGVFWKLPLPPDAVDEIMDELGPAVARIAEAKGDAASLAVLEAIAAIAEVEMAKPARAAADRMAARGVPAPGWAGRIGTVELTGTWMTTDVYGDSESYYAAFRYPGQRVHLISASVDKALGGIVADAWVAYFNDDPGKTLADAAAREPGVSVSTVDPGILARNVQGGLVMCELDADNDWPQGFRDNRALVVQRMRLLPLAPPEPDPDELDDDERAAIVGDFLEGLGPTHDGAAELIAHTCLDFTCDYLGDDPYRWSPAMVPAFLLDFIPRKVSFDLGQIREVPRVVRAWVRFALERRGLEERWIAETEAVVDEVASEFLKVATDPASFGPAKGIAAEMLASGLNLADPAAVEAWIEEYNERQ